MANVDPSLASQFLAPASPMTPDAEVTVSAPAAVAAASAPPGMGGQLWDDLQAARKRRDELATEWAKVQVWLKRAQARYDLHQQEVQAKEQTELKSDGEKTPVHTEPPQAAPAQEAAPVPDPWHSAATLLHPAPATPAPNAPPGMSSQAGVANNEIQALSMQIAALKDLFVAGQAELANMKTHMQWYDENWNTPVPATEAAPEVSRAPLPIDRKAIEKPFKYNGDIVQFIRWQEKLKGYLKTYDMRWTKFLECIEDCGAKAVYYQQTLGIPVPAGHVAEDTVFLNAGVLEHKAVFKDQLHTYLTQYTEGTPALAVSASGVDGIVEVYRKLADAGRSRRPEHLLRLQREILNLGVATGYEELDSHIVTWEHNVNYFHRIAPKEQHVIES